MPQTTSLDSLLAGDNAAFLDGAYAAWLRDPASVAPEWAALFASFEPVVASNGHLPGDAPEVRRRSIFSGAGSVPADELLAAARRQAKVAQLIRAWRVHGHLVADIDPLGRLERGHHPELDPETWDLHPGDMDKPVSGSFLHGVPEATTPREIHARLRRVYAGSFGAEFMNIQDQRQKVWIIRKLESTPETMALSASDARFVLERLSDAEGFEGFLHTRFPGTKRFSLEGAETLIPLLEVLVERAAASGVEEVVLGMAHRGRLNVLANVLEKPVSSIVGEFEDAPGTTQGAGDVKYHLGYSAELTTRQGHRIYLSLTFNPSHLEAVNPVVEGRVRARQDRLADTRRARVLPLLLHGDAAFSGQGLVTEVLNLSELEGYRTGGTVHVLVNNQIGFTTPPRESRSTTYATDVARMLGVPIFHVNGEDPEAVVAVVGMAMEWRNAFHRDVVIDMYCYRKHGHNEGDEPSFTQPLMYDAIRSRPTPREAYARRLVGTGLVTQEEVDRAFHDSRARLSAQADEAVRPGALGPVQSHIKAMWERYTLGDPVDETDTTFPLPELQALLRRANTLPGSLNAHPKVQRLVAQRLDMADGVRPLDWATAEQAAFATLLVRGHPVRLSGQDSARGTFSQRHAVVVDVGTGEERFPLQHLADTQGTFTAVDSSLSEAGVLGFEFGYALDAPDTLVLWEAQFGDFVNGAQVIIDQFITSSQTKWGRLTGLVLLLPHGYEGQGPEHSSARPERFLLAAADGNIQVANCTTPASYYHLLRRQMLRTVRRPLVILTPKSLLRHPEAVSSLEELAAGRFQSVIPDTVLADPHRVRRVVFCSGKVYYDLLAERRRRGEDRVALVRAELLYPFPRRDLFATLRAYPDAAEVVWCQEEPRNMGPWPVLCDWIREELPWDRQPRYVGRRPAASPAPGSYHRHQEEQAALVDEALTLG